MFFLNTESYSEFNLLNWQQFALLIFRKIKLKIFSNKGKLVCIDGKKVIFLHKNKGIRHNYQGKFVLWKQLSMKFQTELIPKKFILS